MTLGSSPRGRLVSRLRRRRTDEVPGSEVGHAETPGRDAAPAFSQSQVPPPNGAARRGFVPEAGSRQMYED